ncbi:uncharacterized protein LOC142769148 isoform X2 [Rhipicephalus microplus]|uniref:uncharacterized protein LOC142769148 isoform X2 n=1 Tax=Rhipicephalus microplus TaxID=6941 RepID=UPI003F6AFDBE
MRSIKRQPIRMKLYPQGMLFLLSLNLSLSSWASAGVLAVKPQRMHHLLGPGVMHQRSPTLPRGPIPGPQGPIIGPQGQRLTRRQGGLFRFPKFRDILLNRG